MHRDFAPSRRAVLAAGGGLMVSFALSRFGAQGQDLSTAGKPVAVDQVDTFLAVDAAGNVTLYSGKVDLGTGVRIGLQQIVAEELDVPLAAMSIIEGDTALTPDQGPTYGSLTIQVAGMVIRQAAATARQALLDMAAQRLGASKVDLTVANGVVTAPGGQKVSYGELIGGKSFSLNLKPDAPQKDPSLYKVVGKPIARPDIPEKLTGQFTYIHDFRVPGM